MAAAWNRYAADDGASNLWLCSSGSLRVTLVVPRRRAGRRHRKCKRNSRNNGYDCFHRDPPSISASRYRFIAHRTPATRCNKYRGASSLMHLVLLRQSRHFKADIRCSANPMCALCQKRTHAAQQKSFYSITLSARSSSVGSTVRPSAFAVLRLRVRLNMVGFWTGRLAGLSPLRMRLMYPAAWRINSAKSTP